MEIVSTFNKEMFGLETPQSERVCNECNYVVLYFLQNTLMESYSQVEVYEEEYPDLYDDMQGPVCAAAVDHLVCVHVHVLGEDVYYELCLFIYCFAV